MDKQIVANSVFDCKSCRLGIEAKLRAISDRLRVPVITGARKAFVIYYCQPGRMLDQKINPPRYQLLTDAGMDRDFSAHLSARPARFEMVLEPVARTQHIVGLHLVHVPALQDRQGPR